MSEGVIDRIREKYILSYKSSGEAAYKSPENVSYPNGKIHICISPDIIPYVYYDENGNLDGYDIQVMRAICDKIGCEPVFVPVMFSDLLASVAVGRGDAGISAIIITDEREKIVTFSDPYASDMTAILIRK